MIATLLKGKQPDLASLETAVADAAKAVTAARANHRELRISLEIAKADLAEYENADTVGAHNEALGASQRTAQALGAAQVSVLAAEKALTLARETPARAALAEEFVRHADLLDAFDIRGVRNLRDALRASFFPIAVTYMPAGGTHTHREFVNAIEAAANEVEAGRLTNYAAFLRSYARQLIDGTVPLDVGPCIPPAA